LLYRPFLRRVLRRASRIVVSSPNLMEHAAELQDFRDKCVVIPFGIDVDRLKPTAVIDGKAADIAARFPRPRVLFVGRLVEYKGVEYLIRAMEQVDASALIVGDGPLRNSLEVLANGTNAKDRIHFPGHLSDDEVIAHLRACDVFVLPSITRAETFGIVQLEAMACGKPVVSTDLPSGVPWVNQHRQTGLVVPPADAVALRAALDALLGDEPLRRELGEAGRRRVEQEFTRAAMAARLTAFYRTLAPAAPRRSIAKRAFDVALSSLGLLASSPVWLLVAVAVKLDDGGPVFYRQPRTGIGGRAFTSWKFRSMIRDADARFGPRQAAAGDARVTRVGRLLRATALDELPQLWNILRGDMSFVGPRALMPEEIAVDGGGRSTRLADVPGYEARHAVTPGLTGVAQVYADRDVPHRAKFRYDLFYIRRRSFALDLKLIALSFWISFRGRWERRGPKV